MIPVGTGVYLKDDLDLHMGELIISATTNSVPYDETKWKPQKPSYPGLNMTVIDKRKGVQSYKYSRPRRP